MSEAWSAGIVCFDVEGIEPREVVEKLLERKIIASITPYQQPCARLSAGIMNDEAEVDRAIDAVAELANARRLVV